MSKRRGFTLIELTVVIAIIGILILLGQPKYKEYSNEAKLTQVKVNVKELETATQKYYMVHNDWPRLSDVPYTAEEVENFGEEIFAKTGKIVVLESEGNYYDINYDKINNYVKIHDEGVNYILQNPVGNIFYIDNITPVAKKRLSKHNEPIIPDEPAFESKLGQQLNSPESGWKRYDDNTNGISYIGNGWSRYSAGPYYLGSRHQSSNKTLGDKVSFSFKGTKIRILSCTHSTYSNNLYITIDGIKEHFSQVAQSTNSQIVTYEKGGLGNKVHTVEIGKTSNGTYSVDFIFDALDIDEEGYLVNTGG